MNFPRVSIIILNWNGLEDTIECLESLRKINYNNYHVIVIDNGSEGDDVNILKNKYGDYIHIVENDRNYGFAEGNNIGIRSALKMFSPHYVLLLNNDTVVAPNLLSKTVEIMEEDHKIGLLGPAVYDYYHPKSVRKTGAGVNINWHRGTTSPVHPEPFPHAEDSVIEAACIEGSCVLIRKEVIDKVGVLDSQFFAYWEETDFCVRVKNAGYKICCALNTKIWHKVQPSYTDTYKLYYFLRNNILFMRKNAGSMYFCTFIVYFIFVSIPLYCFKPFLKHPVATVFAIANSLFWQIRH